MQELPRKLLHEVVRSYRRFGEAKCTGFENGFGKCGVHGNGAEYRIQGGGQRIEMEGAYFAGDFISA